MSISYRTADEAKADNIAKMGGELGLLYSELWQQLAWLYHKWQEYVVLFGDRPERITLLNQAAPSFFGTIEKVMFEDVILHLARLIDPPKSVGKSNLTFRRLSENNVIDDEVTKVKVIALIDEAKNATKFCKDWRNRKLAHISLDFFSGSAAMPLATASREKVGLALKSFEAVLNTIAVHYLDTTLSFDSAGDSGGAEALLYVLDDGVKAEEARRARIKNGDYKADDFARRSL